MTTWDPEQLANARLIVAVGLQMKMSSQDILTALITAMQESSLRNLPGGDRDSAGLFQQRPSQGWGSYSQVTNPIYSTTKFYTALQGIGARSNLEPWQAAQAVQQSAFPAAYANWMADAQRLMGQIGVNAGLPFPLSVPTMNLADVGSLGGGQATGTSASTGTTPAVSKITEDKPAPAVPGVQDPTANQTIEAPQQPDTPGIGDANALNKFITGFNNTTGLAGGARGAVIAAARSVLGMPYLWGGGGAGGPTSGYGHGSTYVTGFDCSGLVQYALAAAGIKMPRVSYDQLSMGQQVPVNQLQPGDLVGMENGGHIAIYIGGGNMIEAPYTGSNVRISPVPAGAFGVHLAYGGNGGATGIPNNANTTMGENMQQIGGANPTQTLPTSNNQNSTTPQSIQIPGIDPAKMPEPLVSFPGL